MNTIHGFSTFRLPPTSGLTSTNSDKIKINFLRVADFISTNSEDTINLASEKIALLKKKYPENQDIMALDNIFKDFLINSSNPEISTSQNVQDTMRLIYKLASTI